MVGVAVGQEEVENRFVCDASDLVDNGFPLRRSRSGIDDGDSGGSHVEEDVPSFQRGDLVESRGQELRIRAPEGENNEKNRYQEKG